MERGFGDSTVPSVVVEEIEILERVRSHLGAAGSRSAGAGDYDSELVSLRDAIAEARPEDVPPLVEHMTRLQALAAQRGMGDEAPLDPSCPYFGHLGLEEGGERRDVLLGKRTYLAPEAGIRIVDWRNAPVSRMYYRYDEGDDYEEEFGGTVRRGDVVARRSVTVADGELVRVSSHEGVWVLRGGEWQRLGGSAARLSGGQGAAVRAERTATPESDREFWLPRSPVAAARSRTAGIVSSTESGTRVACLLAARIAASRAAR